MLTKSQFNKLSKDIQNNYVEKIKKLYLIDLLSDEEISKELSIGSSAISNIRRTLNIKRTRSQIKERRKQTCLEKYGVENLWQLEKVIENTKNNNPAWSESSRNKRNNTNQKRYGGNSPAKSKTVQEKMKQTCFERYGVENPFQDIKNMQESFIRKYGSYHYLKTELGKNKYKDTMIEHYGVENSFALYKTKETIKHTNMNKYGTTSFSKTDEFRNILKSKRREITRKQFETMKRNNSFKISKLEKQIYILLCQEFGESNVESQCLIGDYIFDFKVNNYIIDIHGSYWHNYRPFNNSKEHIDEYEKMINSNKHLADIANCWRYKDVNRLLYCKSHKINYLALYLERVPDNFIDIIKQLLIGDDLS